MRDFFDTQTILITLFVLGIAGAWVVICLIGFKKFEKFSKEEELRRISPADEETVRKELEADPFKYSGKKRPKGIP